MPNSAVLLAYWVHDLDPFLIQFTDTIGIRYYGLSYVLGFLGGAWLLHRAARRGRLQVPPPAIGDLMIALVIGVLVGGRLGYFFLYQPRSVAADPLVLLRVWEGGMASHGGFVGVAVALAWFARRQRISLLHLGDAVVAAGPLGLMLGRIANFINGELWGRATTFKWAVIFPESAPPGTPVEFIAPRHASQLYAAALEGALLLAVFQWRYWRTDVSRRHPGQMSGEFLVAYAIVRAISEQFREPDAPLIGGLTRGTFYSLFVIIAGVALIWWTRRSRRPAPPATP
jgi:phosphatidylglycerol---prolipoprotein diacylglyceryl transferase